MKRIVIFIAALVSATIISNAQVVGLDQQLQNFRPYNKDGINVFEPPKDTADVPNELKIKLGAAFALQFQSFDHKNRANEVLNDAGTNTNQLVELGKDFNLATANLDIDVQLYDGVNLHLRTYLSSRHHPEPYVKGGYIQIDKLDFISEGFLENVMKYVTVKVGHMENNYGDAHFRRSDNALSIYNPFSGNYIMDAFTTEVGGELYYRNNGWLAMVGMTNGKLNQAVNAPGGTSPSTMLKLGYDKQLNEDLRVRLTGSMYHTAHSARTYLYGGDRAGSRYYFVMENTAATSSANYSSGLVVPGFTNKLTAFMINPFVKYKGFEFFGLFETVSGQARAEADKRTFNQYGAELLYRFGRTENLYIGGRYNGVSGETAAGEDIDVTRFNLGGGWFLTKNILAKAEYVNQKYDGYNANSIFHGGKFNGFMLEAVIAF